MLIHRIAEINDISFLKAIKTILDSKTESKVLTLTPEQKDEIVAKKKKLNKDYFIITNNLTKK